jgi:hypothetical protein
MLGPKALRKRTPASNSVSVAPAIINAAVRITGKSSPAVSLTAVVVRAPPRSRWR